MSTYGRAWDTVVAVLEDYRVEPFKRSGEGITLADALADSVYDLLVEFGRQVERSRPRDEEEEPCRS